MKVAIFSRNKENISGFDEIIYQNPKYYKGDAIECDVVFTDDEKIASIHRKKGIEVEPITEPVKETEESVGYDSMSWPKLRSLASELSEEPVKNKSQALKILKEFG